MDGSTGYYAKCSKSGREKQILCGFTYVESIKETNEQIKQNKTEQKETQRNRDQTDGHKDGGAGRREKRRKRQSMTLCCACPVNRGLALESVGPSRWHV